jgi:hypothetical protein
MSTKLTRIVGPPTIPGLHARCAVATSPYVVARDAVSHSNE